MKITKQIDVVVTVTPEDGERGSLATDFAREAFEKVMKEHNLPIKPDHIDKYSNEEISISHSSISVEKK